MTSSEAAGLSERSSRRALLKALPAAAALVSSSLGGCLWLFGSRQSAIRHRRQKKRQQQVGGISLISFASQRKRIRKQDATVVVHNRSQLLSAIKKPGAVIWIPGKVTIDMTGYSNVPIAPNVKIASNRHLGGADGALIRFDDYAYLFTVPERGVRLTGLRLRGPQTKYRDFSTEKATYANAAFGIWFKGQSGIVDNCEMFGWPGYAIGAGTNDTPTQMWIHHNEIHHTQLGGLGYALESLNGMSLLEWNAFSHYRHVVSGYGQKTNGYEFRCNIVGPPNNSDPAKFPCDMHSLGEQDNYPDHIKTAGKYINVHHNVFELTEENAMSISGIPTMFARFVNNWTAHSKGGDGPGEPAVYIPDGATLKMHGNHFGRDSLQPGQNWLQKMNQKISISKGKPSPSSWSPSKGREKNKKGKKKNGKKPRMGTSKKQQRRIVRSSSLTPPGERSLPEVG